MMTTGFAIDNARVMLQNVSSLTDNSRGIIYNCNIFKVKTTGIPVLTELQTYIHTYINT
jgi:hypothetical protein